MKTFGQIRRRAAGAVAALGLIAASCHRAADRPPNVVMVVIDTLRADRLGIYGNRRGLTPFLDQFSQRGVVFGNTYANSSWTVPSIASLFTSRYPSQHHAITYGSPLGNAEVALAETLRDAHYTNAGFSANYQLPEDLGYGQGFAHWMAHYEFGDKLRGLGLEWLDANWQRTSAQPVFLYFQYIEPHWPYDAPEPFRSRFGRTDDGARPEPVAELRRLGALAADGHAWTTEDFVPNGRLYDATVAAADDQMRLLIAALEQRGFLDNAIVIITADHGEELGEHGGNLHGRTLYDESVRVPLIVVGKGIAAGRRVEENVSLIDIAPTVLDLLGLPAEPRYEGRSLAPLLRATADVPAASTRARPSTPDVILELLKMKTSFDERVHVRGILRGSIKYLEGPAGGEEAYDLASDPAERRPEPPTQHASQLRSALKIEAARLRTNAAETVPEAKLDPETKEKLRVLGYRF